MAKTRTLDELLAAARAELSTNPTITAYDIVDGEEVRRPVWCVVCKAPRNYELLTNKHPAIPDFQICRRCGNGVAMDREFPEAA